MLQVCSKNVELRSMLHDSSKLCWHENMSFLSTSHDTCDKELLLMSVGYLYYLGILNWLLILTTCCNSLKAPFIYRTTPFFLPSVGRYRPRWDRGGEGPQRPPLGDGQQTNGRRDRPGDRPVTPFDRCHRWPACQEVRDPLPWGLQQVSKHILLQEMSLLLYPSKYFPIFRIEWESVDILQALISEMRIKQNALHAQIYYVVINQRKETLWCVCDLLSLDIIWIYNMLIFSSVCSFTATMQRLPLCATWRCLRTRTCLSSILWSLSAPAPWSSTALQNLQ